MLQLKMKHLHNFFFTYSKGSWLVVSGDSEMCEHLAPISITLYNRKIPYACKVAVILQTVESSYRVQIHTESVAFALSQMPLGKKWKCLI